MNVWLTYGPPLVESVSWLIGAGFSTTLYASLTNSQDAGLTRLIEKFPKDGKRIDYWQSRWDQLRAAAFLVSMICTVGSVATGVVAMDPSSRFFPFRLAALGIVWAAFLSLMVHVLPRVISMGYADLMSVRFLPLAAVGARLLFPLAWPLAGLEQRLLKWMLAEADEENRPSREEEILYLVDRTSTEILEAEEREMIKSVFEFGETVTREVMTPRVDVMGLEDDMTVAACCDTIKESPYSRFPVYRENIDHTRGFVHVKALLRLVTEGRGEGPVGDVASDIPFVPGTLPLNDLLKLLRDGKEQIAIVMDEYGGTAGLITMEDIIEELVGDIHDEFDQERLIMQRLPDGSTVLDARILVDDANSLLSINLPTSEEYDTLGGLVVHQLGRIPKAGEAVQVVDLELAVHAASDRRIQSVRIGGSLALEEVEAPS
jgi:CBS domain containing-hemolysin-like protein